MDALQIAENFAAAVAPVLPFLKLGAEEMSKKAGERLGEKFQGMWNRAFASKPVKEAAIRVADNPDDEAARKALVEQIETLMQYNVELAGQLEAWAKERAGGITAANGGVVIQGDNNKVATGGSIIVGGDLHGGIRTGGRD